MLFFLASLMSAHALEDDFKFDLEGYYRFRGYSFRNLYADQDGAGSYMTQRLRLQPQINFDNRAKFTMMADVMDDVVWGDNQSLASTSLFAASPSYTQVNGYSNDSFHIKRAWLETNLAIGVLRAGRQESHWGMGLLANAGNGFDDAFGENHGGATFDRILFVTRPLAVTKTLFGLGSDAPFYMGYAFDRLVEDPLQQYYGYTCEKGLAQDDPSYDARCYNPEYDLFNTGLTNIEHGYVDATRSSANRDMDWMMDNNDDVTEHVVLAIYKGENVPMFSSVGDLTAGVYVINRSQKETESQVWISDAYVKFLYKGIYAEGEALNIRGSTRAIVLPGSGGADPLYKEANISSYVGRLGTKSTDLTAYVETGYASGDDSVIDVNFTGRPIDPDYNVGLLIYDQVLSIATARTWTESASALWSQGGVYNSRYINPLVQWTPIPNWQVEGGFLKVWPDKADGAVIQCTKADIENPDIACGSSPTDKANATANAIGWELDAAIKARLQQHILFSTEMGYAAVTDRINLEHVGLNTEGKFFTIQTRLAYEF